MVEDLIFSFQAGEELMACEVKCIVLSNRPMLITKILEIVVTTSQCKPRIEI